MAYEQSDILHEIIEKAVEDLNCRRGNVQLFLKEEQRKCLFSLLGGRDVLAVLPTGFGKSLIFTLFVISMELKKNSPSSILVISPLTSIMVDQICELKDVGFSAVMLSSKESFESTAQFIFASAELALSMNFISLLKKKSSIYSLLDAIVVDESHVVETWTGKR